MSEAAQSPAVVIDFETEAEAVEFSEAAASLGLDESGYALWLFEHREELSEGERQRS